VKTGTKEPLDAVVAGCARVMGLEVVG
jgi:hypothetical protein